LYWNKSILREWNYREICWWCGSAELSREHKYKKTDINLLYGSNFFQNDKLGLLRYRKSNELIKIHGPDSDYFKFQKSLCQNCNNARSAKMDSAYTKVIEFYLNNEQTIKGSKFIDFKMIFHDSWLEDKRNFYKYCLKHIGCRLVAANLSPSKNIVAFLNDDEPLKDVKIVFQLKQYFVGDPGDEVFHLYTGPLNRFEERHLIIGKKITAAASWYTLKQFSINYLYRLGILHSDKDIFSSSLINLDFVDFKAIEGQQFQIDSKEPQTSYGKLVEYMEYFPFNGVLQDLLHYQYLKGYKS